MLRCDVLRAWELIGQGLPIRVVAQQVGVSHATVYRLVRETGGVKPQLVESCGLRLSLAEREEIAVRLAQGWSYRRIAQQLNRAASTISRELRRNGGPDQVYRGVLAQRRADRRVKRPKPSKLSMNPVLRHKVEVMLDQKKSPEQIAGRLKHDHPGNPDMHVSHETIYQELYIQTRGGLNKELSTHLRRGHTKRKSQGTHRARQPMIKDKVMIKDRPVEVDDRIIPGHWEGDLIMGTENKSAIGVVIERVSNLVLLVYLPEGHGPDKVAKAISNVFADLPSHLRRSVTWDQGREMANHRLISATTGLDVYFCDPHSPWQRASNENTNGLLRQYFPKGTSLKRYTAEDLRFVEAQMNDRPRKRLGFLTPAEVFQQLLADPNKTIHDVMGVS